MAVGGKGEGDRQGRVFFEFTRIGPQVRVAAIDEATGIEVVVVAPAHATQLQMRDLALGKLRRRLGAGQ